MKRYCGGYDLHCSFSCRQSRKEKIVAFAYHNKHKIHYLFSFYSRFSCNNQATMISPIYSFIPSPLSSFLFPELPLPPLEIRCIILFSQHTERKRAKPPSRRWNIFPSSPPFLEPSWFEPLLFWAWIRLQLHSSSSQWDVEQLLWFVLFLLAT